MTYPPFNDAIEQTPPTREQKSYLTVYISWLVILLCVGYIVFKVFIKSKTGTAAMATQVELGGRYLFGASRMYPADEVRAMYAVQLRELAKVTQDRLLIAPVLAEFTTKDEVTKYLNETDQSKLDDPLKQARRSLLTIYGANADALSKDDRQKLKDELGWSGKLALTWQQPDAAPERQSVINSAKRTAYALIGFVVLIIGLLVVGLIMGILALIFSLTGVVQRSYIRLAPPAAAYVEGFAIFLTLYVGTSFARPLLEKLGVAGLVLMQVTIFLTALWPLVRGIGFSEFRRAIGWHTGKGVFTEIGCGLAGYLSGLPIVALGAATTFFLIKITNAEQPIHPIAGQAGGGVWNAVMLYLAAAVLAPLMEETLFRGLLYNHVRSKLPWALAAAIVGIIFAAIHPQGWAAIPVLGSIGFVLAMIREWRGSLIASITAHAFNNGVLVTMLILATS